MAEKPLPQNAEKILSADVDLPHAAEIVSHFMAACGGPQEFSQLLYGEFKNAEEGSIVRQRILDMIIKLLNKAHDDMPTVPPLGLLEDSDLRKMLLEIVHKRPKSK